MKCPKCGNRNLKYVEKNKNMNSGQKDKWTRTNFETYCNKCKK